MSWWSIFRSTVVPTVQQAVASTTQQEGAAAADTPVPTTGTVKRKTGGSDGFNVSNFFDPADAPAAPQGYQPSGFAQNAGLVDLERAIYEGYGLPEDIRAALRAQAVPGYVTNNINIMGIRDEWLAKNPWYTNPSAATDKQLWDEFVTLNQWRANHAGNDFSREFGDELQQLAQFDLSGLSSLALGDPNPHGMLGLQLDAAADLSGTRPEELAGAARGIAGSMNPFVGGALSMGPVLAYGADVGDQAENFAISQAMKYGFDQAAPFVNAGAKGAIDWIRKLGLTPEQAAALAELDLSGLEGNMEIGEGVSKAVAPASGGAFDQLASSDMTMTDVGPGRLSADSLQLASTGTFDPTWNPTQADISGFVIPDDPVGTMIQIQNVTGAATWDEAARIMGFDSADALLSTAFPTLSGQPESFEEQESPQQLVEDQPIDQPAAEQQPVEEPQAELAEEPAAEQPAEEPAAEQPAEGGVTGKDLQRYFNLAKKLNELLGQESPEGAPSQDEGESGEQYSEELAGYLEDTGLNYGLDLKLSAQEMADLGLQPGSPEYLAHIQAQADLLIARITEGTDLDAEDLSEQLRTKTEEELKALQRALYVRGQIDTLVGSGTVVNPVTGEQEEVIGSGEFNPGTAGYQRSLARDVAGINSLEDLQSLLRRGFDPYQMQATADARYELAKLNENDERRRRFAGDYGWDAVLDSLSPEQLRALLAAFERG